MTLALASAAPAQVTHRVSVDSAGAEGSGASYHASISADGRYVAFTSEDGQLVPGDTNGHGDVFVRDRLLGTTERVSVDSAGVQGDGESRSPRLSASGRYVVFESWANNLVGASTPGTWDVFLHDRRHGTTELVSLDSNGTPANVNCFDPSISADGRTVAFWSSSANLVPGDTNGWPDVFVRDRQLGVTERVSLDSAGAQGNRDSWYASISADGRYVAFFATATNLVPGDTND